MLRMVSYPRRPQSGHFMCYLNRTYHVLPTHFFVSGLNSRLVGAMLVAHGPFSRDFISMSC